MQVFKTLTVTGLRTTPNHLCAFLLNYCASDGTVRIKAQRDNDCVTWEDVGGFIRPDVYIEPREAFHLTAVPVAAGADWVRVDFIFTVEAEDFLRQGVLYELRLTWPDMRVTEDEIAPTEQPTEAQQVDATEQPEKRGPKAGTFERVQEAHRLMKSNPLMSRATAFKQTKIDSRTYDQWCLNATGEEPIKPYRD